MIVDPTLVPYNYFFVARRNVEKYRDQSAFRSKVTDDGRPRGSDIVFIIQEEAKPSMLHAHPDLFYKFSAIPNSNPLSGPADQGLEHEMRPSPALEHCWQTFGVPF